MTPLPRSIGAPATRALATIDCTSIELLADFTEAEIKALHGMGPKALRVLGEEMKRLGMSYKKPASVTPADLLSALQAAKLAEGFAKLPPSHQRDYITYIDEAKAKATRERRIAKTIEMLRG